MSVTHVDIATATILAFGYVATYEWYRHTDGVIRSFPTWNDEADGTACFGRYVLQLYKRGQWTGKPDTPHTWFAHGVVIAVCPPSVTHSFYSRDGDLLCSDVYSY